MFMTKQRGTLFFDINGNATHFVVGQYNNLKTARTKAIHFSKDVKGLQVQIYGKQISDTYTLYQVIYFLQNMYITGGWEKVGYAQLGKYTAIKE